jgi:peptidoglycan/LPS O-acetylase OafA/YrhL
MPEPVRNGQRYLPGLDGLRALAVLAVVAFHVQLHWAQGGLLGVGVFFTLSGYLITDLLLGHWQAAREIRMGDFWLRRARRLLPALFVVLAAVTGWALVHRGELPALRGAVAAALGYVSNWWLIAQNSSYFAKFSPPSPLGHLWSLAVEEQFYLVWPCLLWIGLRFGRGQGRRVRGFRSLAVATLVLAAASAAEMTLLYHPGYDPTRIYDGTDTRAFALLIGAALAMLWPSRRPAAAAARRCLLDAAGAGGLLLIAVLVWRTSEYSAFLYRGGLVLLSVATAVVVAAAVGPGSWLGRALGWRPLRWVGVRSYGIYLWHYPVIVLTTPAGGGETGLRALAQVAVSVALAAVSWKLVEEPIRHGALGRLWARARAALAGNLAGKRRRRHRAPRPAGWPVLAGTLSVVALACVGCVGLSRAGPGAAASPVPAARPQAHPVSAALPATPPPAAPAARRSSCHAVAHIGDSTSEGLTSPDYLPDARLRITAQYARVGATVQRMEISGARSLVETWGGQPNGQQVARRLLGGGYRGCWVLALGTNDTANVAVGSPVSRLDRIRQLMALVQGQPVLWVNVVSLLSSGDYSEANMRLWNRALVQACAMYPNLAVYDWAAAARRSWFIPDGVHYTSAGYAARSRDIARALAAAFPAGSGHRSSCVVR